MPSVVQDNGAIRPVYERLGFSKTKVQQTNREPNQTEARVEYHAQEIGAELQESFWEAAVNAV